jgi:hypothetical protein
MDPDSFDPLAGGSGRLIIDNATQASDHGVVSSSSWWTSSSTPGFYGSDYSVASTGPVYDPARFWFKTDEQRCYVVEAWWPAGPNRASAITWLGWDQAGREVGSAVVDQRFGGKIWNLLGEWTFPPGRNQVLISRWTTEGAFAVADAIRLTPCGSTAPHVPSDDEPSDEPATTAPDLDVPYFYQYDNRYEPSATCGVTSTAMVINWWQPGRVSPDDLYLYYGKAQAQSPSGVTSIYQSEGLYGTWTQTGTRAQIRAHLDEGRPVVAHGFWTSAGHITAIVGYDDQGWIVNDPAGDWEVCYGCGGGDHVRYAFSGGWDQNLSWDGDIWFSVSDTEPF